MTRIALPGRVLEAYRLIRPFIANLRDNGYESTLMETELTERNCYRKSVTASALCRCSS